jgi:hypothetical protein
MGSGVKLCCDDKVGEARRERDTRAYYIYRATADKEPSTTVSP